jgi:hypothetical protein
VNNAKYTPAPNVARLRVSGWFDPGLEGNGRLNDPKTEKVERLMLHPSHREQDSCLTSSILGQNWRIEEGRVSGSS